MIDALRPRVAIGIDPGAYGGIVVLARNTTEHYAFGAMDRYGIRNCVEGIAHRYVDHRVYCCLEKVNGFIAESKGPEGKKKNVASAHTAFSFGKYTGRVEMALICARISFTEVLPSVWMRHYDIEPRKKGEKKGQWKARIANTARLVFPNMDKITIALADAFLIAGYCRSLQTW